MRPCMVAGAIAEAVLNYAETSSGTLHESGLSDPSESAQVRGPRCRSRDVLDENAGTAGGGVPASRRCLWWLPLASAS
jgi:hypothetical protein